MWLHAELTNSVFKLSWPWIHPSTPIALGATIIPSMFSDLGSTAHARNVFYCAPRMRIRWQRGYFDIFFFLNIKKQ